MNQKKTDWKRKILIFVSPNKVKIVIYLIILFLIFLENFGPLFNFTLLSEMQVLGKEKDIMVIDVPKYHLGYIFEITSNIVSYYKIATSNSLFNFITYVFLIFAIIISFLFYYLLSCFFGLLINKILKIRKKGMLYASFTSLFLHTSTRKISRIKNNEKSKYVWIGGIILLLVVLAGCTKEIDGIQLQLAKETIDTSIIKKEVIEPMIVNNSNYCSGKASIKRCICQNGYAKVIDARETPICLPKTCVNIFGTVMIGDVGLPNYDFCLSAITRKRVESCDVIDYQQGKEICVLAYVELTGDTSECVKIEDENLKNECYK